MTNREPPEFATWLLQHFMYGRMSEAVTGDLYEQFAQGRSKSWYWRQVVVALLASYLNAVRKHGLSFAGAVAAGWAVLLLWRYLNLQYTPPIDKALMKFLGQHLSSWASNDRMMLVWSIEAFVRMLMFAISGWWVAQLHHPYRRSAVCALIATVVLWRVPWLQLAIFDGTTVRILWCATAVGGILLGGFWEARHHRMNHASP